MTPAAIRSLLRRCLQREPERRLRDISDARFQIEDALNERPASGHLRHRARAARGSFGQVAPLQSLSQQRARLGI